MNSSDQLSPYHRDRSVEQDEDESSQTRFAVLATCSSDDSMTLEVYRGKTGWDAFGKWIDRHGYHGYVGSGKRQPGPPPHAEIDLYSGGDLMERVLVVPAAALEVVSS